MFPQNWSCTFDTSTCNKNLLRRLIWVIMKQYILYTIKGTCDLNPCVYSVACNPPTVEVCVVNTISLAYNFSYHPTRINGDPRLPHSTIRRSRILSEMYVNETFGLRRHIISTAFEFSVCGYLVAKEKLGISNIFAGPFGTTLWVGLFLSYLATFSLLLFTMKFEINKTSLSVAKIRNMEEFAVMDLKKTCSHAPSCNKALQTR